MRSLRLILRLAFADYSIIDTLTLSRHTDYIISTAFTLAAAIALATPLFAGQRAPPCRHAAIAFASQL